MMNPESLAAVQPELLSGETILWADQPSTKAIFHREDRTLIPFGLLWTGFAIFWEAGALGYWGRHSASSSADLIMGMWGIPFVIVGQYFVWGRFLYARWRKKQTYYAVTNQRVIAVQKAWKRQLASAYIDVLPILVREDGPDKIGTLRFGEERRYQRGHRGNLDGMDITDPLTFRDIDQVGSVYTLIAGIRDEARASITTKRLTKP